MSTTRVTLPQRMMSWTRTGHSPGPRRLPLRKVPLVLPRSRTRQPLAVAHRGVVEHDFQRVQATGAQQVIRFPDLSFNVAIDAPQTDATLHR
jgi:hypothetical protein